MPFSHAQQVALALVPKFPAALSIAGSSWILFEIFMDRKKQRMVYHRLMFGMSFYDIIISTAWWFSTWPVPAETAAIWGNYGNQATCTAQGFFVQFKIANPFYNTFLSLYYVLVIRFRWSEKRIRTLEPAFHVLPLLMALGTSVAGLFLDLYNSANLWCWIAAYPAKCAGSARGETCERGDDAWIYRLAFFYTWYWASLLFVTIALVLVYWTVRAKEVASQEFSTAGRKNTSKVATQCLLYIGAYYLTALFATITRVMQSFAPTTPFWPILCMTIFYPSQGLFNFLIYMRPRYLRYRRANPDWTLRQCIRRVLGRAWPGAKQVDDDCKLGARDEERVINSTATGSTVDDRKSIDTYGGSASGNNQNMDPLGSQESLGLDGSSDFFVPEQLEM